MTHDEAEATPRCARCGVFFGDETVDERERTRVLIGRGKDFESFVYEAICFRCDVTEATERYRTTKEVYTRLWSWAELDYYNDQRGGRADRWRTLPPDVAAEIHDSMERVSGVASRFHERVWPRIRDRINKTSGGLSGTRAGLKMLALESAGRALVTIADTKPQGEGEFGGATLTLIYDATTEERTGRGGIQGVAATEEEAVALLETALEKCPRLKKDKEVGFGF